jgi:hypothetical protein
MHEEWMRGVNAVVFGPPTLEDKLRDYIDSRDTHKARNAEESDAAILQSLRDEKNYRDAQHTDNQQQFRQLFRLGYIGLGMLLAVNGLAIWLIPILVAKH